MGDFVSAGMILWSVIVLLAICLSKVSTRRCAVLTKRLLNINYHPGFCFTSFFLWHFPWGKTTRGSDAMILLRTQSRYCTAV